MYRKKIVLLFLIISLPISFAAARETRMPEASSKNVVTAPAVFGPRTNYLKISFYSETTLPSSLENGEIDILDSPWGLGSDLIDKWSQAPYNETTVLDGHPRAYMYELDINNNETIYYYPNWISPTNYKEFRHAIAHLVDKRTIINTYLKSRADLLSSPIFPWLDKYYTSDVDPHNYDPSEAAAILNAVGFLEGQTMNPYYDPTFPSSAQYLRTYPSGHTKEGQNLDPLKFLIRYDPVRTDAQNLIIAALRKIGVPIDPVPPIRWDTRTIYLYRDFHLYMGAWMLSEDPDFMFYLYHSSNIGAWKTNYNSISDPLLDEYLEKMHYATNETTAVENCLKAQKRLMNSPEDLELPGIVGTVPIWSPIQFKAHNKRLVNVVNEDNIGADSWWTFLCGHFENNSTGGTIKHGLASEVNQLNPLYSAWMYDWEALGKIYDTLLMLNPYSQQYMPGIADDWKIGSWNNPDTGQEASVFTFNLRPNALWHDGFPLTSEDIKFTIEYMKNYTDGWFYYNVADVHHVQTNGAFETRVYMNTTNIWSLYSIAGVSILPKHIWQNITDPSGFSPDPTLTGSGPWKFVEYAPGSHILLRANTHYYMQTPLKGDVNLDSEVDIYDLIILASVFGVKRGEPEWDMRADIQPEWQLVDIYDLVSLAVDFGKTWQ